MTLEAELQVFNDHLMDLLGVNDINEGKYAVVCGTAVDGPYDDYAAALKFGYETYGLRPFLARKIERTPAVMFISRGIL